MHRGTVQGIFTYDSSVYMLFLFLLTGLFQVYTTPWSDLIRISFGSSSIGLVEMFTWRLFSAILLLLLQFIGELHQISCITATFCEHNPETLTSTPETNPPPPNERAIASAPLVAVWLSHQSIYKCHNFPCVLCVLCSISLILIFCFTHTNCGSSAVIWGGWSAI